MPLPSSQIVISLWKPQYAQPSREFWRVLLASTTKPCSTQWTQDHLKSLLIVGSNWKSGHLFPEPSELSRRNSQDILECRKTRKRGECVRKQHNVSWAGEDKEQQDGKRRNALTLPKISHMLEMNKGIQLN